MNMHRDDRSSSASARAPVTSLIFLYGMYNIRYIIQLRDILVSLFDENVIEHL